MKCGKKKFKRFLKMFCLWGNEIVLKGAKDKNILMYLT